MKVIVRDPDTFQAVRPLDLASYLHATGWQKDAQIAGGTGSVWLLPQSDGNDYEILLPLSTGVRDYVTRVSEAIHTLAAAEDRSELEILSDLAISSADVLPLIREASSFEEFEVQGMVTKLDRDEKAAAGRITIIGFVEQQARQITVELRGADYDLAILAHRDRVPVLCNGDLIKEGRSYVLRNPHGFSLAPVD